MTNFKNLMLGAVATTMLLVGAAKADDDVKLRLNWMYYGSHAGFALGKVKGFYKDAGINLDIRSGNGSGSAHRLVANGDSDFSYGSCGSMVNLASQGAALISVAVIDAMGADAVLVRPDAGITKISDLKGKKLLTTSNAGVNTFFRSSGRLLNHASTSRMLSTVPAGSTRSPGGSVQTAWSSAANRSAASAFSGGWATARTCPRWITYQRSLPSAPASG